MFVIRLRENDQLAIMAGDPKEKLVKKPYCETYGQYGNQIGCYDAGCYSKDNTDSDWKEGEEEQHWEATVFEYWDGHNWRSICFGHEVVDAFIEAELLKETEPDLEKEILEAFEKADKPIEFKQGYKTYENNGFKFTESLWQGDYALAWVEEL